MITFDRVTKRYRAKEAVGNISFHIERGEIAFVTGHSGAGKSTLLRLIPLLERPTGGSVKIGGVDLAELPRRRIPHLRRGIGMTFQDHRLLTDRNVFDNVALPLLVAGMPYRETGRRVRAALDKVGLLEKEGAEPVTLSGGEQQRVGIARAVVTRPPILLADEPTGNLDPALSAEIMGLFERFSAVGVTTVIASHDAELIERMGHRRITLRGGRLAGDRRGGCE